MFNTILVGTDAAAKGRKAVTVGEALAQITGDRLLLVAVRPDPLVDIPALHVADQIAQREELAHRLRALRDELAPGASTGVQPAVSVAHGLRIAAKRERAGLVVMGVSARHGAARLMEGDHALQVMHGAPCGVLVVPETPVGTRQTLQQIVVGADNTPEAAEACRLGAELAARSGARLHVVTVVDDAPPLMMFSSYAAQDWDEILEEERAEATRRVQSIVARSGVARADGEVLTGSVVDQLVEASREADLLVLGSRRWGAIRRVALGSTTAHVLRTAHCPVLVPPRTSAAPAVDPAAEQAVAK